MSLEHLTRADVIELLDLQPLPGEGGFFRQTYQDEHSTCIYFLVGGDAYSALHRLVGPEGYHFYAGAPLELFTIDPQGHGTTHVLGNDIAAGQRPQLVVPGQYWQGSRSLGKWTLVGTTMAPGFKVEEFELANRDLITEYPRYEEQITLLLPVDEDLESQDK